MIYLIIIVSIIFIDRTSKILALNYLAMGESIPIIKGVFHLTYAENTGAAFSMLSKNTNFLVIVTLILIIALVLYFYRELKANSNKFYLSGLCFILGGAIGNLIDRIYFGFVVDYFDFCLINFAIFNVADSFICVGVALMAISLFIYKEAKDE